MASRDPNMTLAQAGRDLVERLGGYWSHDRGLCRCPAHDDRRPSLGVQLGRSRLLFHCFAGCPTPEVLRALRAEGIGMGHVVSAAPRPRGWRAEDRAAALARRLWSEARALGDTLAEAYLLRRLISAHDPQLRFHHRVPDGPRPVTRFRPALLAAVRDETGLVALHRTFLRRGGPNAPSMLHRAALGRLGAGAVRLGGCARRLGLAEGIETALSVTRLFGLPCWATLGAGRFSRIALPDEVEAVDLFLDNDAAGRRIEARAREAFAPRRVEAHLPRVEGADWNDVLRAREGRERR